MCTLFYLTYSKNIERGEFVLSLFSGVEQHQNFSRIKDMFPIHTMTVAEHPYQFPEAESVTLPDEFKFQGKVISSKVFLNNTDTSSLLVLHQGKRVYEKYWLSGGVDVNWLSMSVAKSFISTAIGIAIDEELIASVNDPVNKYIGGLDGSAYAQVTIKDVLQMSSGANWNEDYNDPESDVLRMGKIMAVGGSLNEFVRKIKADKIPGSFHHYNSADTQVLGELLISATGRSIADYMQEKIWHPLGMNNEGYWMVDDNGVEMAFGGLNATARDYAKLGEMYRNKGVFQGRRIVSRRWVEAATQANEPHLLPGNNPFSSSPLGYGYQWWVPEGSSGEYLAIGVYNQFIYIDPSKDLVIVKLSANSDYGTHADKSDHQELESIALFRAIAKGLRYP